MFRYLTLQSEKDAIYLKKKLDDVEERLDGLKSLAEYQEDELNAKYTSVCFILEYNNKNKFTSILYI